MTSNSIIVSVKLCLNVGNNDYITLCNFGDLIMCGRSKQKKPGLDRVNATVHTQSIHFNESVDELVTFQWRKQAENLFIAVFLLACNVSRCNSLLILGGVGVRVSLP